MSENSATTDITTTHAYRCMLQGCFYGSTQVCQFCSQPRPSDIADYGKRPVQTILLESLLKEVESLRAEIESLKNRHDDARFGLTRWP